MFGWVRKVPWRKVFTFGLAAYWERDSLAEQAKKVNKKLVEDILHDLVLEQIQEGRDLTPIEMKRLVARRLRDSGFTVTPYVQRLVDMVVAARVQT